MNNPMEDAKHGRSSMSSRISLHSYRIRARGRNSIQALGNIIVFFVDLINWTTSWFSLHHCFYFLGRFFLGKPRITIVTIHPTTKGGVFKFCLFVSLVKNRDLESQTKHLCGVSWVMEPGTSCQHVYGQCGIGQSQDCQYRRALWTQNGHVALSQNDGSFRVRLWLINHLGCITPCK